MEISLDCIACGSPLPAVDIPGREGFFKTACQICGTEQVVNFGIKDEEAGPVWIVFKATDDRPEAEQDIDLYFILNGKTEKTRFKRAHFGPG
jgi:hypothetical protein